MKFWIVLLETRLDDLRVMLGVKGVMQATPNNRALADMWAAQDRLHRSVHETREIQL